ncbi:MAG: 4-hydroxythreonine-4-phosphate dehydrogenase PdxA [Pseudomonadota bacterium]
MARSPIAVSMGDPSGIGPDILLATWSQGLELNNLPDFFVTGSSKALSARAEILGLDVKFEEFHPDKSAQPGKLQVLETDVNPVGKPGQPETADANCTIEAIDLAVDAVFKGTASAVVTCPINKDVLYGAGFTHPGHTEYLGALANEHTGEDYNPVMMLAGPQLRTVPITIHIALADVETNLTEGLIVKTAEIVNNDMQKWFGIQNPRIALAGLNPHAGENGKMGRGEIEKIAPAIETLKAKGINVRGPLPADTMFHGTARQKYDVALCMYHDQALIPAKMLGFDDAVNVTLGLPFIRTSPDHGTAYDIAGSGKANPSSFIAALRMAAEMAEKS